MSKQNLVEEYKNKIENSIKNKENIFLRLENNIECKNPDWILWWMIVGIKDNIMTKWNISSCGSKMLANYVAPYTATCIENLQKNWWIVIWKTNMDEFAMWSTNETSFWNTDKSILNK